jgi:hypothetical protein
MSASTRHFARHYVEMVVAMFLGMGVLLPPLGAALRTAGTSLHDSDVLMISAMALTMTVPMIAWMRYREHGWPVCADMAAAMVIPTLSVLALLWSGLVGDLGTLLRRDEYTGATHRHAQQQVAA